MSNPLNQALTSPPPTSGLYAYPTTAGALKEVYVNVSDIEDLGLRKTRDPPMGKTFTVKEPRCLYHVGRVVPKVHTVVSTPSVNMDKEGEWC
jgi:hypothetical protein